MMKFEFHKWPFAKGEEVIIHWISSPRIINGEKICNVYFRTSNKRIEAVPTGWGSLPELWIGRKFVNQKPIEDTSLNKSISIPTAHIKSQFPGNAVKLIPLQIYPLKVQAIYSEICCSFFYDGYSYVIPCVEIVRAFLARNSVLANLLLSTGGLEELIDPSSWMLDGNTVNFHFRHDTPGISPDFARDFAKLYGMSALRSLWDSAYSQYVSTGLIISTLPPTAIIELFFIGNKSTNKRFVSSIKIKSEYPPFKKVNYGPEKTIHSRKSTETDGIIDSHLPTDDSIIDLSGELAKPSRITTESSSTGGAYMDGLEVKRLTVKDDTPSKIKVIEQSDSENTFSVGDISGAGKKPFINIEMKANQFDADPNFTQFCEAIDLLGKISSVSILDLSYAELPDGKWFSRLQVCKPKPRRKFACVTLQKNKDTWLIIELCNIDRYSISTLFVKCTKSKDELVNEIIDKLMICNGSWSQDYFPSGTFKTLDHHKGRSSERWAELMYYKLI